MTELSDPNVPRCPHVYAVGHRCRGNLIELWQYRRGWPVQREGWAARCTIISHPNLNAPNLERIMAEHPDLIRAPLASTRRPWTPKASRSLGDQSIPFLIVKYKVTKDDLTRRGLTLLPREPWFESSVDRMIFLSMLEEQRHA